MADDGSTHDGGRGDVEARLRAALRARAERTPVGRPEALRLVVVEQRTGGRWWLPAASVALVVAAGVVGLWLVGARPVDDGRIAPPSDQVPEVGSLEPGGSDPSGGGDGHRDQRQVVDVDEPARQALLPPGMGVSIHSAATSSSSVFASLVDDVATAAGWVVTVRESATRLTVEAGEVQWAYLMESERRLFVTSGAADLLDRAAWLAPHLRVEEDPATGLTISRWPEAPGPRTVAVADAEHTVVIRSEGIELDDPARSSDELVALAIAVLTAEADRVPIAQTPEWTGRRGELIAGKAELGSGIEGVEAVNAGDWAYLSDPVDIDGPGRYELVFRGVHFTDDQFGGGFQVPPDTEFSHFMETMEIVEVGGERRLVVELYVPVEDFGRPYEGWRIWFV